MVNRSNFTATKMSSLKEQEAQAKQMQRRGNFADFKPIWKLDDGKHIIRIYPAHPNTESYIYLYCQSWLPRLMPKKDDKNNVIKKKGREIYEVKRMPVFNARVHGNTEIDIIEFYINLIETKLKDINPDKSDEILKLATDYRNGMSPSVQWIMYAAEVANGAKGPMFTFAINDGHRKRLNQIAMTESGDEEIEVDPFSDVDEGRAIVVTIDKKADNKDKYQIDIDSSFDRKSQKINLYPFTDKELEEFLKFDSLESRFKDSYTKRDFELAIEGLRIFDEENDVGVIEMPEFLEMATELEAQYPDPKKSEGSDNDEESEEEEDEEEPDEVDLEDMNRKELKAYIKENNIPIIVKAAMTDDYIREIIQEHATGKSDLPWDKEESDEIPANEVVEDKPKKTTGAVDRLAAMKAKMAAGKK